MKAKFSFFDWIIYAVLFIMALCTILPFIHVAALSFSGNGPVMRGSVGLWPQEFNLNSYKKVLGDVTVLRAYWNTLVYTVLGTFINIVVTALTAYCLASKRMPLRRFFTGMILFTMLFSGGMIPTYLLINDLHMIDTLWAMVLPGAVSTWNLLVMRTFFQTIPESLTEAAMIDGASDLTIFFRIYLPLSSAALATITLFYAVGHWNSYFNAMLYLNTPDKYPLQIKLRQIVIQGIASMEEFAADQLVGVDQIAQNIKYTVIMVAVIPILMVYPFLQKYFVKGIMIGADKG